MSPSRPIRSSAARALCALLAFAMTFAPVTAAYGAPTPLADIPIAAKVTAKPNIVYTLDDSGSMQYNYLPDYVVNSAANISVSLTRQPISAGVYRARTSSVAAINAISVGDWINVIGAAQAEYNGFFQVINKPSATTLEYVVGAVAAAPVTVAAGYGNIQIVTSAAYCRSGSGTATCPQQAVSINSSGNTVITGSTISRPTPISTGGLVTATLTNTAANLATINSGDAITISNSTTAATSAGGTSDPYYGTFVVTKISATQLTYQINAIANNTLISAGGNKYILFGGSTTFAPPPLHVSDFNRLAYNPAVTYTAPLKADGTPLTNSGTDSNGNYGFNALKWASASVDRDPFASYEVTAGVTPMWPVATKDNLSIRVAVQLYCNTDWPTLVNEPNGPATVLDAGDANGQYQSGKGSWCRINGTKYDASVASGAPAAAADYNYPWQSSSGALGAQYFYRQIGNKVLWCDTTSPYWPRNTSNITGCNGGTNITVTGPPTVQTCVTQSKVCNPTVALRNYTPSACKTDPAAMYCLPNTGGSDGNSPGTGTLPECLACTCNKDTNPSPPKKCSSTGLACNVNADCPDVPGATTVTGCTGGNPVYGPAGSASCTSLMFDPYTNAAKVPNTTLLQDSNGPGVVCRHNNQTYTITGVPAAGGLFTYSRTNLGDVDPANKTGATTPKGYVLNQQGKFITSTTSGCPAVGTTVQIPRHYYVIDKVEFCDNRNVTVDAQWRGFGAGTCVDNNDLQRYKEIKYGTFTRVDLFPGNAQTFAGSGSLAASATPYPMGRSWLAGTLPGPDNSESINYANWYAYYSTRLNAAKSTSATAFSYLTNVAPDPIQYRVGFHTLGEEPSGYGGAGTPVIWLDVEDWDLTQRTAWYNKLFGISVSTFKTPTLDAMLRVGNLFETGGSSGLPAPVNPLPGSAKDPIATKPDGSLVSCQNNYHILFTDGKTNQVTPITTAGDQDQIVPTSLSMAGGNAIQQIPPEYMLATLAPLAAGGQPWPAPFKQGVAVSNTLADVASYYWARDLRPSLKNDVPAATSKLAGGTSNDAVSKAANDVAWWQHLNFNAISFGAEGTLDAGNQPTTLSDIVAGTKSWPDLTQPYNPLYPKGAAQGAVAVDDLWHATVVSRGQFVFARSPIEVSYGLASILAGIQNQRKSRAGAAFGGQVLSVTNNIIFEPTIEPGWAGDLLKVEINPATGDEVQTWWQASTTLRDQIDPVKVGVAEPWMKPAHRRIVTLTGSTGPGVPFQYASLSSSQLTSLAPTATEQQKIISYLRGGNTWTDPISSVTTTIEGTAIGQYRQRFGVLGDLSNAQPVVVFSPSRPYVDATDPGYSAYKAAYASRSPRVVAAANDGMVHVFDTGPMPQGGTPVSSGGGTEVFAYMPRALFKGAGDASGIQALTYQDGGVPIYRHHMYVDSSPRVADIYDGAAWRTIVVGGLGKGGNSYYALDLTNADASDEAQAAAKVMWEWSDPEVKYSYGRPVIVKVRDSGYPNGRWVVIVTGGYDNASGKGKVFFLDAVTGTLLSTVTTAAGSPPGSGQAAGLAQIHAFVKAQHNQVAEQVYGGDLLGNIWRIDVSGVDQYKSASALLFATVDDGSSPQPITTAPQIEIDINNGVDRYVFFGTGRLLDTSDFTTPTPAQMQTMYAIRDGTIDTMFTTGLPINARTFTKPINVDEVSAIVGGAPNGWHQDLSTSGERIVVDPSAAVNIVAYVGTMVQDDPCIIALPANLYGRDYTTGESLLTTSSGGPVVASIYEPEGIVGAEIVGKIDPVTKQQTVGIVTSKEIPGAKPVTVVNKFRGIGNRISWKLLGGQ